MLKSFLRVGKRYINTAQIAHFSDEGGNVIITLLSTDSGKVADGIYRNESEYLVFKGQEAKALLWWLHTHSHDVMEAYADVLEESHGEWEAGALDD